MGCRVSKPRPAFAFRLLGLMCSLGMHSADQERLPSAAATEARSQPEPFGCALQQVRVTTSGELRARRRPHRDGPNSARKAEIPVPRVNLTARYTHVGVDRRQAHRAAGKAPTEAGVKVVALLLIQGFVGREHGHSLSLRILWRFLRHAEMKPSEVIFAQARHLFQAFLPPAADFCLILRPPNDGNTLRASWLIGCRMHRAMRRHCPSVPVRCTGSGVVTKSGCETP